MLNTSIREYIINNFRDSNVNEIRESIDESIINKDEITLPGLGVFFEILWKNSSDKLKEDIINIIDVNIKK